MSDFPRVLLLGDSIRQSYQPWVARLLGGEAEVIGRRRTVSAATIRYFRWIGGSKKLANPI